MAKKTHYRPVVLMIIDGYGFSPEEKGNAVRDAKQPNMARYMHEYPFATITAAGIEVGLPWGEMGNSETGHQNIGSGRVVYQPLPRISLSIQNKTFFQNQAFLKAIDHVKKNPGAALHTIGMLSNGGVHSHIEHQLALVELAAQHGVGDRLFAHAFLDGRDSPPDSAGNFVKQLDVHMKNIGAGHLATMIGRYYAMDRNNNWDRTQAAYELLVNGKGQPFATWQEGLAWAFKNEDTKSYEVAPGIMLTENGQPMRTIADGDAVIIYNYREDRSVQLASALTKPGFDAFPTKRLKNVVVVTMTDLGENVTSQVAFPTEKIEYPLGRVVSEHKLKQLRIAESEKFAHVTYFFNGGREKPYPGEERVSIPSKNVPDYAKLPEMSAAEISDRVVSEIKKDAFDVIVMNYANPDMVGHTGNVPATVKAIEFLDGQIGRVVAATLAAGGSVLLTCDHGNAEEKNNQITHKRSTDHTINPVPLIYIAPDNTLALPKTDDDVEQAQLAPIGLLADVAPTFLDILGIAPPKQMTAQSLLKSLS